MDKKVESFTDLRVWQKSHKLVLSTYKKTRTFPREERYGLTQQIRRAAVSITSNIAEGFSRATSKDKQHFYSIAIGSLTELQSQLLVARDLDYMDETGFSELANTSRDVSKMLNGLKKSIDNL